jgi:hypothetical protein
MLLSVPTLAAAEPGVRPPPEQILDRMELRFEHQMQTLASYQARRSYSVEHTLLEEPGTLIVEEQYRAPEEKRFRVVERRGSAMVQEKVFARLLEVEQETAQQAVRRNLDLNRRNYRFAYEGYDPAAGAYVFTAEPRGSNPYLLRGKIWINEEDFAVQRIEGEPATRHSRFVRQTRFVHEFARFGEFWLPVRHRSETDLFLFGRAVLRIDYFDYHWEVSGEVKAEASGEQAGRPAIKSEVSREVQ